MPLAHKYMTARIKKNILANSIWMGGDCYVYMLLPITLTAGFKMLRWILHRDFTDKGFPL